MSSLHQDHNDFATCGEADTVFIPLGNAMKSILCISLCVLAATLVSCSSFEKDWNDAVADYESGAVKSPEGPWKGSWTTSTNGHTGDLRAIVTKSKAKPDHYNFRYHAKWADFFSGSYRVSYPVEPSGSGFRVDGEQKMGPFGTFSHKGQIQQNSFKATYSSDKGDLGAFDLKRP